MTTSNLAAAIAQAERAVARHESQNAGDPFRFDLTEHRYVALRDLLTALSSPPADDVREALARSVRRNGWLSDAPSDEDYAIADAFLARFEVRPYGTVTDVPAHAWVHVRQERPGEVSLRCSCGLAWKHYPMPHGTGTNLPGCPDAGEVPPYGTVTDTAVERSCEIMHDAYEAAAAAEGWETQHSSRKPWADVPDANKRTMRYAVRTLLEARS